MFQQRSGTETRISPVLWWIGYFIVAMWAQELSGGFDFFSPGLLVCLQMGQIWPLVWMTFLVTFVQEGMGTLVFGTSFVFYAGMYLAFFLLRWLLEPRNPFFVLLFALFLAAWSWLVLLGGIRFQEIPVHMIDPLVWISRQWLFYVVFWSGTFLIYQRWVRHGHV